MLLSTFGSCGGVEPLVALALAVRSREVGEQARMGMPPDEDGTVRPAVAPPPADPNRPRP
ncbi:hypothetical protein [Streptomyces uncialis]|uniref:hypothetical protein n=1 Tax=Streptomyces uncialis TaxID=1048205 RepID=UPI00386A6241|nr:hypothetical protein OG924_19825 [Streptomyces uncialis]